MLVLAVPVTALHSSFTLSVRSGAPLYERYADLLRSVRSRMTPQDRVFLDAKALDFPFFPKLASIFQMPAVIDYEPQTSRR